MKFRLSQATTVTESYLWTLGLALERASHAKLVVKASGREENRGLLQSTEVLIILLKYLLC